MANFDFGEVVKDSRRDIIPLFKKDRFLNYKETITLKIKQKRRKIR